MSVTLLLLSPCKEYHKNQHNPHTHGNYDQLVLIIQLYPIRRKRNRHLTLYMRLLKRTLDENLVILVWKPVVVLDQLLGHVFRNVLHYLIYFWFILTAIFKGKILRYFFAALFSFHSNLLRKIYVFNITRLKRTLTQRSADHSQSQRLFYGLFYNQKSCPIPFLAFANCIISLCILLTPSVLSGPFGRRGLIMWLRSGGRRGSLILIGQQM